MGGGKKSKLNKKMKASKSTKSAPIGKPKNDKDKGAGANQDKDNNQDFNNKMDSLRARMYGPKKTTSKRGKMVSLAAPTFQFGSTGHIGAIAQAPTQQQYQYTDEDGYLAFDSTENNGAGDADLAKHSIDRYFMEKDKKEVRDQDIVKAHVKKLKEADNRFAALGEYEADRPMQILLQAPTLSFGASAGDSSNADDEDDDDDL